MVAFSSRPPSFDWLRFELLTVSAYMTTVNIGQAAKASGLSERMIRYFEKQGLIPAPERRESGYRSYTDDDVRRMRTIALAQDVGFPVPVIAQLVSMMDDAKRENPDAESDALAELDRKTEALQELCGRIHVMVDRARAKLIDDEPDIDWGPPILKQAADLSRQIKIVTVKRGSEILSLGELVVSDVERDRHLTSAN